MASTALCAGVFAQPQDAKPRILFVSPAGSDTNTGESADKSLATPMGARDRIRAIRAAEGADHLGVVRVVISGGVYELSEPWVLEPQDSGREGAPVIYAGARRGRTVISGGRRLPEWRIEQHNGRDMWVADVPLTRADVPPDKRWSSRELFVNGHRCTLARTPNTGYLQVQDVPNVAAGTPWHEGTHHFRFKAEDAPVWGGGTSGTEVVAFTRWVDMHLVLDKIDAPNRTASFVNKTTFLLNPDDLYYVEGGVKHLDAPGEFAIEDGKVFYLPMPDESPQSAAGVVPVLHRLVELRGRPEKGEFVQHVTFDGLTFSHAQWWFGDSPGETWPSAEVAGFKQAAWGVPGAIVAEGARKCEFSKGEVSHVAGYGIELGRGCSDNMVWQTRIQDLGAGGVKIGEATIRENAAERSRANTIDECTITDGGHLHHQAVGVWIGQSAENNVTRNVISNFEYTGISIGWTWGYGPSLAGGNVVELNEVGPLGPRATGVEPALGDMAGIYTLGTQQRTVIRKNYFHDIAGRSIAWGIYFDEGSTGIVAEDNLVLRTTHGGFHQHYGKENVVRNNIFAFGRDAQVWRTRNEEHLSFTLERNIFIADNDKWFAGDWTGNVALKNNIYWRTDGKPVPFPGGRDLAAWLATGLDTGSKMEDPKVELSDPLHPAVAADSPARPLGFVPFDLSEVGPRLIPR